ncbi:MAG: 50S ribosomal protein L6 [Candidatus Micrarchaeia archaeon]
MIEIEIAENTKVEVSGNTITVSGSLGKNSRAFNTNLLNVSVNGNKIVIDAIKEKKVSKKASIAETSLAKEIKNDIKGVNKYFEINMKAVFAHFPLSMNVKDNMLFINNLFGERVPRTASIVGNTKVEINGQNLKLKGTSLDDVTQSAANIRKACRAKDKDTRVFQDGIYYAED